MHELAIQITQNNLKDLQVRDVSLILMHMMFACVMSITLALWLIVPAWLSTALVVHLFSPTIGILLSRRRRRPPKHPTAGSPRRQRRRRRLRSPKNCDYDANIEVTRDEVRGEFIRDPVATEMFMSDDTPTDVQRYLYLEACRRAKLRKQKILGRTENDLFASPRNPPPGFDVTAENFWIQPDGDEQAPPHNS